ncbi:RING finger protein 44-like [Panicum hallii]|uniref:RING finger protein 44-like n=1 Tax=Panicum hallii TaxID=206008 RepID=UPI000DF4D4A6|nr:RING finger protein 44-like [Panicum hallii]
MSTAEIPLPSVPETAALDITLRGISFETAALPECTASEITAVATTGRSAAPPPRPPPAGFSWSAPTRGPQRPSPPTSLAHQDRRRQSGANAAAEAAALGLRPPRAAAPDHQPRHGGQQPRGAALPEGEPRRASGTAGLPSFTYNRSVKQHNVTGGAGGEEAATCSVCLGAFQVGETVRLLPVCLHLYHVECIDPWLEAHSSCPICRTGTETAVDGGLLPLPPV